MLCVGLLAAAASVAYAAAPPDERGRVALEVRRVDAQPVLGPPDQKG